MHKNRFFSPFWTSCLGNLFEHYETALFGFLSPFLAPLIFPNQDPISALLFTYAMIPLGMVARPLGALVFGYVGDVYGRREALFLTLSGMAVVSCGIAFSPTYSEAGLFAAIFFWLGRALQNFFAAGETMGGAIFLLENAPEKQHNLLSGLYNASSIGGHLLASFGVFLVGQHGWLEPGWRFLYLAGCVTALFGALMRRRLPRIERSIPFSNALTELKTTLLIHKKALALIAIGSGFGFASYSMALVFINGFLPLISPMSKAEAMKINTYLIGLDLVALPFFGYLASRVGRKKVMLSASLLAAILSIPLFLCLEGASWITVVAVRIFLVLLGVAFFAPFHAWASERVPPKARYAVLSLGYALGAQILGSPTAALALWSFQKTGLIWSAPVYWAFLALASSLALLTPFSSREPMALPSYPEEDKAHPFPKGGRC
jgi:MFS family permease